MQTPMSPALMPMTPAFGPMNGSAMPFAAPTRNVQYGSAYPQEAAPRSYAAQPTMYSTQNYAQQPTYAQQQSYPQTYGQSPVTMQGNQFSNFVSPEAFYSSGFVPEPMSIPVTRIATTLVHPIPQVSNFTEVTVAPKYSTQMSARVKYQGPALRGLSAVSAKKNKQSITVSVQPHLEPNNVPVAGKSYAKVEGQDGSVLQNGTKILAEFYLDRKWYPAMVRYFDTSRGQYVIDWADKDENDRFKLPSEVVKRGESCTIS